MIGVAFVIFYLYVLFDTANNMIRAMSPSNKSIATTKKIFLDNGQLSY